MYAGLQCECAWSPNSYAKYDSNAIRVDNVRREQIGHIPRQMASTLARYMVKPTLARPEVVLISCVLGRRNLVG